MRYLTPLAVLILVAVAGCSSNKSDENPRPESSVQGSLDSAANRVVRDTADTTAQRDTSTAK
ncbi:MAG TPA: hypothetical protein VH763_12690 [Gemmatimonadales bacterium]|jgi:hypothetical protein